MAQKASNSSLLLLSKSLLFSPSTLDGTHEKALGYLWKVSQHSCVQWTTLPADELTIIQEAGYSQIILKIESNVLILFFPHILNVVGKMDAIYSGGHFRRKLRISRLFSANQGV